LLVVDDHHLLAVLARQAAQRVQSGAEVNELFTTASWYYRLARAANDITFIGALSRRVDVLQPQGRELVLAQLDELPATIGLVSARLLVPVMAKLRTPRLNHLAAEALATAVVVEGSLVVVATSEPLTEACRRLGVDLDVRPV